jgi:AICAR transformylase/IMP cyclohydrolase PurH
MSNVINISDKFAVEEKGQINIKGKVYEVDKSIEAVMLFEEIADNGRVKTLLSAIEGALGAEAAEEIGVKKIGIANMKVLVSGLMAVMQDMTYEEATKRFQL